MGVAGRESQKNGLYFRRYFFFFLPRLALRAKCRVYIAWLIKLLLCRLAWNVRAQRGRNTTQLYMQLDATIDDVTRATQLPVGCKGQNVRSSSVKNVHCWLFILGEKRFTVGKSRSILPIQIVYNAVKRHIL